MRSWEWLGGFNETLTSIARDTCQCASRGCETSALASMPRRAIFRGWLNTSLGRKRLTSTKKGSTKTSLLQVAIIMDHFSTVHHLLSHGDTVRCETGATRTLLNSVSGAVAKTLAWNFYPNCHHRIYTDEYSNHQFCSSCQNDLFSPHSYSIIRGR